MATIENNVLIQRKKGANIHIDYPITKYGNVLDAPQGFNFDDIQSGHESSYSKSGNVTTETIKVTATQAVYATRTTTKNSTTQYTIRTICAAKNVNKTEVLTKTNGTWKGVVT